MKKALITLLTASLLATNLCTASHAVTMYAPDGRTVEVKDNEVEQYKKVGWYDAPVQTVTVYAPDGRSAIISQTEADNYYAVGWYSMPVITMYADDGRTIVVDAQQAEAYKSVGWTDQAPVTMYALDGRTQVVPYSQVEANRAVGWYLEPPVLVFSVSGASMVIGYSEVPAYEEVGWYYGTPTYVYDIYGNIKTTGSNRVNEYLSQGWLSYPIETYAQIICTSLKNMMKDPDSFKLVSMNVIRLGDSHLLFASSCSATNSYGARTTESYISTYNLNDGSYITDLIGVVDIDIKRAERAVADSDSSKRAEKYKELAKIHDFAKRTLEYGNEARNHGGIIDISKLSY